MNDDQFKLNKLIIFQFEYLLYRHSVLLTFTRNIIFENQLRN
jgi:hypothetical protein